MHRSPSSPLPQPAGPTLLQAGACDACLSGANSMKTSEPSDSAPSSNLEADLQAPPAEEQAAGVNTDKLKQEASQRAKQAPLMQRIARAIRKDDTPYREIIINSEPLEKRVALLENGVLEKFDLERVGDDRLVGSIFKGRIQNLEAGLKAAFVDIGLPKNAFLHYWDIIPGASDANNKDYEIVRDTRSEAQKKKKKTHGPGHPTLPERTKSGCMTKAYRPKARDHDQLPSPPHLVRALHVSAHLRKIRAQGAHPAWRSSRSPPPRGSGIIPRRETNLDLLCRPRHPPRPVGGDHTTHEHTDEPAPRKGRHQRAPSRLLPELDRGWQ
jgi:hypothetical protein